MIVKCRNWASGLEKWDKYFSSLTEQYINNLWAITSNNQIGLVESGQKVWNIFSEKTSPALFFYSNHVSNSVVAMDRGDELERISLGYFLNLIKAFKMDVTYIQK